MVLALPVPADIVDICKNWKFYVMFSAQVVNFYITPTKRTKKN